MNRKNAFTLIEVLITLILSGLILTLCVSSVVKATQNHEKKVGYHKAVNTLNNALKEYFDRVTTDYQQVCNGKRIGLTESCLDSSGNPLNSQITKVGSSYKDSVLIGQDPMDTTTAIMNNIFKPFMTLEEINPPSGTMAISGCPAGAKYFQTSDGMRYCFAYSKSGASYDIYGDYTYGVVLVDINGENKPNRLSTTPGDAGDIFPIIIMKDRFIPGHPTDYNASRIAQAIFFAKDEK